MYIVRWKRTALARLTELWLESSERLAITAAVAEIDRILQNQPHEAGESRSDTVRVFFSPPVGVFFEIDDATRTVHVLRVWTF